MRHLVTLLWAMLVPVAALAQVTTVSVRGGEHADYTRLALALPQDVLWQVTQSGRRVDLAVTGGAVQFDLAQTFARIPRTRLLSAENTATGLALTLACDCDIRASEDLPQMLVLDIVSPRTSARAAGPDVPRPKPRPVRTDTGTAARAGQELARALRNPMPQVGSPALAAAPLLAPPEPALPNPPDSDQIASAVAAQEQTLAALGAALSGAVGQGLLQPATPKVSTPPIVPLDSVQTTLPQQLAVSDSVTRARTPLRPTAAEIADPVCPNPDDLAIHTWGPAQPDAPRWPDLTPLYSATDQINPQAIHDVARRYLFLGFGAEAGRVLSLLPQPTPADALLISLSQLTDLTPGVRVMLPDYVQHCGDIGAFWAAIATLPDPLPAGFPIPQALRGVALLPAHLRLHFGPALLRHLLATGDTAHAQTLRDILQRVTPQDATPPMDAALAAMALPQTTQAFLPSGGTPQLAGPEDVLFLLRQITAAEQVPDPSLRAQAEAQIFTLRGSGMAAAIGAELALGLARGAEFAAAFDLLDQTDLGLSAQDRAHVRGQVLVILSTQADDASFLTHLFRADPWADPVAPNVARGLASRLRDLGFGAQADGLLALRQTGAPDDRTGGLVRTTQDQGSPELLPEPPTDAAPPQPAQTGAIAAGPDLAENPASVIPARDIGLLSASRKVLDDSAALRARLAQLAPP